MRIPEPQRLSPTWSVTAAVLCAGAAFGPEITPGERLLAMLGLLAGAWWSPARRACVMIALTLGAWGAARQHAILESARAWEGPARIARVQVERRLDEDRILAWVGAPGLAATRVRLTGVPEQTTPGTRALARLEARLPVSFRNPDDRNRRRESLQRGWLLEARVREWHELESPAGSPSWRERMRERGRSWLAHHLRGSSGLWQALLLGERSDLADTVQERFRRLGLSHLLALSGLHVGLAAAGVMALQRRRRPTRITLAFVAAWSTLAGWSPSLTRAVVMLAWWWAARALRRGGRGADALACAALGEWCVSPWRTTGLGWWLSYVATGAIVVAAPGLARRPKLHTMLGISVAAQLSTLPWLAGAFGQVPWLAPVTLLAVGPAFAVLMILGAALLLTAAVIPPLLPAAITWTKIATHAFGGMLALADAVAPAPWGHPGIGGAAWGLALASSSVLVVPLAWSWRRRLAVWAALVTVAHAGVLSSPRLTWVSLDVGQGDAGVLRSGRDSWLVVDTGPAFEGWSAARRVVLPYLERRNAQDVTLALTHGHLDHIGDARALLASGRVTRLVLAAADSGQGWTQALLDGFSPGTFQTRWLRRGDAIDIGPQRIDCLWPPPAADGLHANDRSLVLRTSPGGELLLTGDLEWGGEAALGRTSPVDVLKVAHHGGNTGTGADLLGGLRPRWALVSCGRINRYGHPHPATLQRLEAASIEVLRTDERGAVTARWRGRTVETATCRGPP